MSLFIISWVGGLSPKTIISRFAIRKSLSEFEGKSTYIILHLRSVIDNILGPNAPSRVFQLRQLCLQLDVLRNVFR